MSSKYITIQEAAELADKSTQTIRRLIKGNKIKHKKKRTPQGFNYQLDKESLAKYFDIDLVEKHAEEMMKGSGVFNLHVEPDSVRATKSAVEEIPIPVEEAEEPIVKVKSKKAEAHTVNEGITIEETIENEVSETIEGEVKHVNNQASEQFAKILQQMLKQHEEDKTRLFALIEQFQKRTIILEERIRKLEAPKRPWWKLW